MEYRLLGATGERLSVIGFGGIVVKDEEPSDAARLVAQAVDRGLNYFDVAPSYGNAEERLGPALEPYRASVFLACKTLKRTKVEAADELRRSLRLLRTDHVDLYQHHAVTTPDDVRQILAPGGAMEAFIEARDEGLIRFIGFSAHSEEAALELIGRFPFNTVLFPLNWASWHHGRFGPRLLERARAQGTAVLALKALARRRLREGEPRVFPKCWYVPVESREEASVALRFTLSLPVTAAVSPGHADLLWWACDVADRLVPLTPQEMAELEERSAQVEPIFRHAAA